jgi:hypothetical protein
MKRTTGATRCLYLYHNPNGNYKLTRRELPRSSTEMHTVYDTSRKYKVNYGVAVIEQWYGLWRSVDQALECGQRGI